jgi:ABC-type branched-subunit amino acid transport system ATPase component
MTPILDAVNLSKSFGGLQAAKAVSLHANAGETVGIIGPNGAGKTTLFNLLTNEIKPDKGSVTLDGINIDRLAIHQRVKIGLARTYQVPRPFSKLTVRENIRVSMMPDSILGMLHNGMDLDQEQRIAESVGFSERQMDQLPSELAMGDLRKLELARTLATDPKLLLLDEVFAGLTYGEIEQISKLLVKRKETHGTTYMIVSHDLKSLAPLVDRVIVINGGSVLMQGTFDEVVGDPQVQDAYLGTGGGKAQ